jgi:hypothetical protein
VEGGGGSIFRKTPDTALYSTYVSILCTDVSSTLSYIVIVRYRFDRRIDVTQVQGGGGEQQRAGGEQRGGHLGQADQAAQRAGPGGQSARLPGQSRPPGCHSTGTRLQKC